MIGSRATDHELVKIELAMKACIRHRLGSAPWPGCCWLQGLLYPLQFFQVLGPDVTRRLTPIVAPETSDEFPSCLIVGEGAHLDLEVVWVWGLSRLGH